MLLPGGCREAREDCMRALVRQALDDLETGRIHLAGALQLIAAHAWLAGHREAESHLADVNADVVVALGAGEAHRLRPGRR